MIELRQSTAGQEVPLGYFLDSEDGDTAETGLTIANTDIKLWKWGATSLANKNSGGATHMAGGVYYAVLDATDTDTLGPLVLFVHVSGALTVRLECAVLPANVWDSKYSTDKLQVDAVEISGDSGAADNLEAVLDGTGIANDVDLQARSLTLTNDAGVGLAVTGTTDGVAIEGTAGSGVKAISSGSNGHGLELAGNGSGAGAQIVAGATGAGMDIDGGSTSGPAIDADATSGACVAIDTQSAAAGVGALHVQNASGHGADIRGSATGMFVYGPTYGIEFSALGAGHAIRLTGGTTTGSGIYATGHNAIRCVGNGSGSGIYATGGSSGHGLYAQGGSSSGHGVYAAAQSSGDGINASGESDFKGDLDGSIGSLATQAKADVNAEILDVLNTDTFAEPGSAPAATASMVTMVHWVFSQCRNKIIQDGSTQTLRNDADDADIASAAISDDGTTFIRGKFS